MSNTQEIISAFKSGQLVLIHDRRRAYLAVATRQHTAVKRALELLPQEVQEEAFVAIGEAPQLYDYVTQIPDLAWDIVEFAEKALHVVYKSGKGVPEEVLQEGKIRVMVVLQDPLHDILFKLHQGILCLPIPDEQVEKVSAEVSQALALQPQSGCRLTPERIMELGTNGEVKFIKK